MGAGAKITIGIVERGIGLVHLKALYAVAKDWHVKVGVLENTESGDEEREGGLTNAQIAAIHEFGSSDGRIPERSFVRATFAKNRGEYVKNLGTLLVRVAMGQLDLDRAFNILGAKVAADIKKYVTAGPPVPPPNAPSTIWKKTYREREGVRVARWSVRESGIANRLAKHRAIEAAARLPTVLKANRKIAAKAQRMREGADTRTINALARATSKFMDAVDQVRPLIDTGRMIASVTWAVVKGG